jgi:hypothetical protein
VPYFAKVKPE